MSALLGEPEVVEDWDRLDARIAAVLMHDTLTREHSARVAAARQENR